jgi:hypothetical protein
MIDGVREALVVVIVVAVHVTANAGNSAFAWVYDTDTLRTRKTELQFWLSEENGRGDEHVHETSFWAIPTFGATSRLELAIPAILTHQFADGVMPRFTFDRHGFEARYRLADDGAVVPLVRAAVFREVDGRGVGVEGDAVLGVTIGRVHAALDLGYVARWIEPADEFELYPRAGVSVAVGAGVRVGVESYAEIELAHGYRAKALEALVVGPNLAVTRGRWWLSATLGIGIADISTAPRVQLGLLL